MNQSLDKTLNITVLGGTGFIGRHLVKYLQQQNHEVRAYGRSAFASQSSLIKVVDGADVLINLTGENIGKRWNHAYKQALVDSRLETARLLQQALNKCNRRPIRILAASAIGIYPQNTCDHPVDEACALAEEGFLGELGQAWEQASLTLEPSPTIMRFGVVLGKDGGALHKMLPAFKLGLGGPVASGEQCFSWIHIDDLVRAISFLINHTEPKPVYNLTAPQPLTNKEFGQTLAKVLNRPFWLPLPEWQLKLMFGEGAQVLTHSSAVVPTGLLGDGFQFKFETANSALEDLL